MFRASSLSRSPRRQMAAPENNMADTKEKPTPVHAIKNDQSYDIRVLSLSAYKI